MTLEKGKTYVIRREVDLRTAEAYTCNYFIYDAEGNLVGEMKDVAMNSKLPLPITGIGISCTGVSGAPVLLDDYKLCVMGLTKEFEVYNANTGIMPADQTAAQANNAAFRLSWLNATNTDETAVVMAEFYDAEGKLVEKKAISTFNLIANADGVESGIIEVAEGQSVKVYLATADESNSDGNSSSNTGLIIGIAAGAVVLVAAVVVVLILVKKKKPTTPAAE